MTALPEPTGAALAVFSPPVTGPACHAATAPAPRAPGRVRQQLPHRALPAGWLADAAATFGALLFAVLAALLVGSIGGCGGGVGSEGTGTHASVSSGPITGFGSIIVGGVHYDESGATIVDDDDTAVDRGTLALGMVVRVHGGAVATDADGSTRRATASSVQTQRAMVGPLDAVDSTAGTVQVLGQLVRVDADTVFSPSLAGGLSALRPGQLLQVWGLYDSTSQSWLATRLDPASAGSVWRLRGTVSALGGNGTLKVGRQELSGLTAGLTVGSEVLLTLRSDRDAAGRLQIGSGRQAEALPDERGSANFVGVVASMLSATRFTVGEVTVDASSARIEGHIAAGVRVEVEGTLKTGVLQATRIKALANADVRGFELSGTPSALDSVAQTFVLRGSTVSYAAAIFRNGSAAQLVGYRGRLQVKGRLADDRRTVLASEVSFGN